MSRVDVGTAQGCPNHVDQGAQEELAEVGRFTEDPRNIFVKRYEKYVSPKAEEEPTAEASEGEHGNQADREAHATESPMTVMVGESTGNKYIIAVSHKGLEPDGDAS